MTNFKRFLTTVLLLYSASLSAADNDIPLIEGIVSSTDDRSMTIVVGGLAYQTLKSTKISVEGIGQITFIRIKPGMKARLIITNPPKINNEGMPILSSIILYEQAVDK